jgi:3-hydroxy-3-methylglutaryl CoA synthase
MVGITSYGVYIPLHRLSRAEIARAWGKRELPGERAVANYDEDSLTMAVAAAMYCIKGIDSDSIDGLYFASTTSPYREKQSAAMIATILGMNKRALTIDFSGSLRGGTNALRAAMDAIKSGSARNVLVCASDVRLGYPDGADEMSFGDGAVALLIGNEGIIAEIEGNYTLYNEIQDVWRTGKDTFTRSGEDRFIIDEGYNKIIPEAITDAINDFKLSLTDFAKVALYSPNSRQQTAIARKLKLDVTNQIQDTLHTSVGNTGTAMSLMSLIEALENSQGGERILLASYGNGCDVFSLKVTDAIETAKDKPGIKVYLKSKRMIPFYNKYIRWREIMTVQPAARPPLEERQPSPQAQWRENEKELRLRGTKCNHCGTAQYPPQRVCIVCRTKDDFEYYSFLDKRGKVYSFSHDYVSDSLDPPTTLTVIDFDGGGRILCEMTDRDPEEIKVGMPVEMTFRRLYYVGGIYNYSWKCRPESIKS